MPIIYTYPSATPTVSDLLVFSDVSATDPAKDTRKCTIGDIVTLVTASVPGSGTVTSVELELNSTGLTTSGGTNQTITGTGKFDISGTLVVANGGTGAGSLTGVIHGNGLGPYTASNVVLTSEVTGILPILNGGTGQSTYTKGDLLFYNTGGVGGVQLDKLTIGASSQVLTSSAGGLPVWNNPATVSVTSVDVSGGSTGLTFSGGPVGPGTGTITMGGALVVANGGTGATSLTIGCPLLGNNTGAITPTAPMTDGQLLIGNTGNPPSLSTLTAGASGNITITNTAGNIEIESAGGGIYGGSGSLGGATVVTTGANDLTFTATTGDVIFNNSIAAANPAFFIDGGTSTVGMGGNANLTDQCSIYNKIGSGNTTSLGIQGQNTTGNQIGANIDIDGAATSNTALKLLAEGAGTNYALVTAGGNSGFGTVTPEGILHTADATAINILQRGSNDRFGPDVYIRKSRGTVGSEVNVVSADTIGTISFKPYFGDFNNTAVSITAEVEGTLGTNITPGRLVFGTAAAGANTTTDTMIIDSTQAVGIGSDPGVSTLLRLESTTRGFLPPVMTTLQKAAIATPAEGLMVYDETLSKLCVYTGAAWETITSA
jgi:hypothetical protein